MKKAFVCGALILSYSNLLFTAYIPLTSALTSIDQGKQKEVLDFLGFLDTTIKISRSAFMEVMVDNQLATCGPMLATITQKINKYQLLSSDEVEYGHAIAGALLRLYMPFFYVRRKTEITKEYEQLHKICEQLHAQTVIAEKPGLLRLFEKPANLYVSRDIERSPSAKVVSFLWQILNDQNKLSESYLPVQEKAVSFDRFCTLLYNGIVEEQQIDSKDVLYFESTYTAVLDNFKELALLPTGGARIKEKKIYLALLHRKYLLEQFKEVNSK